MRGAYGPLAPTSLFRVNSFSVQRQHPRTAIIRGIGVICGYLLSSLFGALPWHKEIFVYLQKVRMNRYEWKSLSFALGSLVVAMGLGSANTTLCANASWRNNVMVGRQNILPDGSGFR